MAGRGDDRDYSQPGPFTFWDADYQAAISSATAQSPSPAAPSGMNDPVIADQTLHFPRVTIQVRGRGG